MLVAAEMVRVAGTSGAILWYDFFVDNPANRDARGVREGEIKQLFPRCHVSAERITLAPPLARCLAGLSWSLCHGLAAVRMLGTHCLALITTVRREIGLGTTRGLASLACGSPIPAVAAVTGLKITPRLMYLCRSGDLDPKAGNSPDWQARV